MSSYISYRSFGLNEEEAKALVEAASRRRHEVVSVVGDYQANEAARCLRKLQEAARSGEIPKDKVFELLAIRNLAEFKPEYMQPFATMLKQDTESGYYTEHESFGCVSHHQYTSNSPSLVGTPTMSSSMTVLRFMRARFATDSFCKEDASISETGPLMEVNFAAEQFAGLLRDRRPESPCAIGQNALVLIDKPPRLVQTTSIAKAVHERAMLIGKPLTDACSALVKFIGEKSKISTKADYAELQALAKAVEDAMQAIRGPMRDLLAEAAGLMAEASTRQLLVEIAEPLKALGMDEKIILMLGHQ